MNARYVVIIQCDRGRTAHEMTLPLSLSRLRDTLSAFGVRHREHLDCLRSCHLTVSWERSA